MNLTCRLLNHKRKILALFIIAVTAEMPLAIAGQRARRAPSTTSKISVPAPRDVLGFTPGDDRKLASWAQMVDYFKRLDRASDRVRFEELGKTTLGRPFVLATI